ILMEAVHMMKGAVTLFSGSAFDVDRTVGLNGSCDYLLTRSAERFYISRPVVTIVEAKREDIPAGLGQCVAALVAARIFNEREGDGPLVIHGAVTTGSIWRFLRLDGNDVQIDCREYYLTQLTKILGIIIHVTNGPSAI